MKKIIALAVLSVMFTGCAEQTQTPPVETPEPEEVAVTKPVNEECGRLSKYQSASWFDALNQKYEDEFLVPKGLKGSVGGKFGAGCLLQDEYIFIPEFFEFSCGTVFNYDTINDVLKTPVDSPEIPGPDYCATEFAEIGDDYIVFKGLQTEGETCKIYDGKYYFVENKVEVSISECENPN